MKFIIDDRVLGRKEEVNFANYQEAWCTLFSRLCGSPKAVEWAMNDDGDDIIIIHHYIKRSEL